MLSRKEWKVYCYALTFYFEVGFVSFKFSWLLLWLPIGLVNSIQFDFAICREFVGEKVTKTMSAKVMKTLLAKVTKTSAE